MTDTTNYVNTEGNCCTLTPGKNLTIYEAPAIRDQFITNWHSGQLTIIDLSNTEEIDTSGVQLLLAIAQKVTSSNAEYRIHASESVNNSLELFDLELLNADEQKPNSMEIC